MAPGGYEGLLRNVVGRRGVAGKPVRHRVYRALVFFHQQPERRVRVGTRCACGFIGLFFRHYLFHVNIDARERAKV